MMGWDEILQPGVPNDIVIQSWRGKEAFYESIKSGYKAILSNGYYIDLMQPTSFHYANDPLPDSISLTPAQIKNVLGGEGTMWSELITPETVDSRIWPRMAAIAERLWSSRDVKDIDDMYRRLDVASLHLEALGLRHELYKQAMLRRLANGYDTKALGILVSVIEPLKIYERNQGDTMYTVFSPYTKIADAATPDQVVPRHFNQQTESFLKQPSEEQEKNITEQLKTWKDNNNNFLVTLRNSPVLQEAAILSANLSQLAASGLVAMSFLHDHKKAGKEWLEQQLDIVEKAKQQGGRCELQVVAPIERLIRAAASVE
jgi:hexosaminidase